MGVSKRSGKEYKTWLRMIARCHDQNDERYPWYGERGIKVCERWRTSFDAFMEDLGAAPTPAHTIDRFPDNDGNYEPGNVRWATWKEQAQNRRTTVSITHKGQTLSMAAWAELKGMDRRVLFKRLRKGWEPDVALETPVAERKKAA